MGRNKYFIFLTVFLIVFSMSSVYAADILEGKPQTVSGSTVYMAEVSEGEAFSSVFGVNGDNTGHDYYGKVKINGGTVTGTVYGARGISGSVPVYAAYNEVEISNSTIGSVYGGYAYGGSSAAAVNKNKVKIDGGSITGYVYGGNADGTTISVTDNSVDIKNATVKRTVYGACAFNTSSWLSMLRNTVTVENSEISGSIYGGYASGSATVANSNTVVIKGNSKITGSVYGGYALSSNSDAKNNTVIIEDGTFKNHIYGGIGKNAVGNTIVIKGGDLSAADLYGYSDGRKSHANNTLELWKAVNVKSACNFENYFFLVPKDVLNTDTFMLKTQTPVNLNGANVGVAVENGSLLGCGNIIKLIDKAEGTPVPANLEGMTLHGGTSLTNYEFNLKLEDGALVAEVVNSGGKELVLGSSLGEPAGEVIPQAKSLLGSRIASVVLLTEVSDLASGAALSEAKEALKSAERGRKTTFLATGRGVNDYYTSAHVNADSVEIITGIAEKITSNGKDGLIGAFVESGNGNYSTFNGFESGCVYGTGNAHYYGVGAMFSFEPSGKKGAYFQVTGQAGGIYNGWSSDDFKDQISYDTGHFYCGTDAGVGYILKTEKNLNCDIYTRFSWTHQKEDSADVNGENLQFDALNFIKTRLGTRITYERDEHFNAYWGFAWERQFNKKVEAKVNTYDVEVAGLEGSSLFYEIGTSFKAQNNVNWQFNILANGYVGVRRGINGTAFFTFLF